MIKKVRAAHQIQDEFQEFNHNVEYMLDGLHLQIPGLALCTSPVLFVLSQDRSAYYGCDGESVVENLVKWKGVKSKVTK